MTETQKQIARYKSDMDDYKARFAANIPEPTKEQADEYHATIDRLEKAIADLSAE